MYESGRKGIAVHIPKSLSPEDVIRELRQMADDREKQIVEAPEPEEES